MLNENENIDAQLNVITETPAQEAKRLKKEAKAIAKQQKEKSDAEKRESRKLAKEAKENSKREQKALKEKEKLEKNKLTKPTYINAIIGGLKGHKRIADDIPQVVRSFSGNDKSTLQAICAFVCGIFLMKQKAIELGWDLKEKLLEARSLELSGNALEAYESILVPIAIHPREYHDFIEKETGKSMIKNFPSYPDSPTHRGMHRLSKAETNQANEKNKDGKVDLIDSFARGERELFRKDPRVSISYESTGKYYANPQKLDSFPIPIENIEYVDAHQRARQLVDAYPNLR
jgi:hypothetical protein